MHGATYLAVGLVTGTGLGTLIGVNNLNFMQTTQEYTVGTAPYENLDETLTRVWPADLPVPVLDIELQGDPRSGMNLLTTTEGFTFTPREVNGAVTPGTGHGHLYINGVRHSRLYGNDLHLTGYDTPGEYTVHVYFTANDHRIWTVDGTPLYVEKTFQID